MVGVFVAQAMKKSEEDRLVDTFTYRLALSLSTTYLLAMVAVILYSPLSVEGPEELSKKSSFALGPLQGLVSAALAMFFSTKTDQ